jgi:hypothetical protein
MDKGRSGRSIPGTQSCAGRRLPARSREGIAPFRRQHSTHGDGITARGSERTFRCFEGRRADICVRQTLDLPPLLKLSRLGVDFAPRAGTALDCLGMQSERLAHCIKRGVLPVSQHNPRSLNPARRFRSRLRNRPQFLQVRSRATAQSPDATAITINPLLQRPQTTYTEPETTDESPIMTTSMESVV